MIAARDFNFVAFELPRLAGADPFLPGPSEMNLLHIIALNNRSTPCFTILIRCREKAVCPLMNEIVHKCDTPCHFAAQTHNSALVRALLQIETPPSMIANGAGKSPLDLADNPICELFRNRNVITPIQKTPTNDPDYLASDNTEDRIASLIQLGCKIPDRFKPTESCILFGLQQFAIVPSPTDAARISIVNRFLASWARTQSPFWYHCVFYLSQFMVEPTLNSALEFLEFISNSTLSPTAQMWIEGILRSLMCAVNHPSFSNVITAARAFATGFGMSDCVPRPCVAEPFATLICRIINCLQKLPREPGDVQLKWIRFLPIGHTCQSFGHLWDSCNSLAAIV
jgi:hypothetical protein